MTGKMNKFSREYLFRESVLHRHCILLHLSKDILWNDTFIHDIYMVDMCLSEKEQEQLLFNWANCVNTYGIIVIKAYSIEESPFDAREIKISTDDINEIELMNN